MTLVTPIQARSSVASWSASSTTAVLVGSGTTLSRATETINP